MRTTVHHWQLRANLARSFAAMYASEVPAYDLLVNTCKEVNAEVAARSGAEAERFGSLERVSHERHGAIRVGTLSELRQAATIFAAVGMYPVGFYDLRSTSSPIPVVSTAFRPIDAEELERNPFRLFSSVLVGEDRRFFSGSLERRLNAFFGARQLFSPELLALAEQSIAQEGLDDETAARFVELATDAFRLSKTPIDRAWYQELEAISSVAADIGGVATTHINHLTPRVLDIDELYRRMNGLGVEMIPNIEG
jgi:uncharacterized glyoxalase superfamily metalloenzyme YdcJ